MDIPNQEKQHGGSFSALFTRTSFRTNQTRQKTLCSNSLATLLLSDQHQPECVLYTSVYCDVWCTVFTDKLLKLCRLRQIIKGKAAKKMCICWKLSVHAMNGLWTLNIFAYEIYLRWGTFTKHDREPLFGHGNTFDRGLSVVHTTTVYNIDIL